MKTHSFARKSTITRIIIVIAMYSGIVATSGCRETVPISSPPSQQVQLFGIHLRPQCVELLRRVEAKFEKPLVTEKQPDVQPTDAPAVSNIREDGSPRIIWNTRFPVLDEVDIAHELSHLELRADGYPNGITLSPADQLSQSDRNRVFGVPFVIIKGVVIDSIEHNVFYPKLRDMGYVPDFRLRDGCRKLLDAHTWRAPDLEDVDLSHSIWFANVLVELGDVALQNRVRQYYAAQGWQSAIERGTRVADVIRGSGSTGSEGYAPTVINVMNVLYGGSPEFVFRHWDTELLGPVTLRLLNIGVQPRSQVSNPLSAGLAS